MQLHRMTLAYRYMLIKSEENVIGISRTTVIKYRHV